ncbi:MAG: 50S ribosomal protein L5 [Candidatus Aenigmarchaeota archaeon]|nr:50S ribosomal protein L5 [Candidatus Aenigmarchaeota archaeon]MDW8149475.1 50S ribosomal protein L5 [Candidatus Aenigmarchaeota archaeon]
MMREIKIDKVVLNFGCGGDLNEIERAKKLVEYLTGRKAVTTLSRKRSTFGIARNKSVGVKVTLRKKEAEDFLKKAFTAVNNTLSRNQINDGYFSFGVKEYIDIAGIKYRHDIGMLGFDVCVNLKRPGYRVKLRKIKRSKIGKNHLITKEETINFLKTKFNINVE